MKNSEIDVLFVGNAIMDVLSSCEESFLKKHDIEKIVEKITRLILSPNSLPTKKKR